MTGHLDWEGCWNARDLGGLPTSSGEVVRTGALVRSDHLSRLTGRGWRSLRTHGVRTLVDLRTAAEVLAEPTSPPAEVRTDVIELEDGLEGDPRFDSWVTTGLFGTPLYYAPFLERFPARCARAVAAVAHAEAGGVLVHCSKGCDRTGLVVALLLTLCDVDPDAIADDYSLTTERLRSPLARELGREDDEVEIAAVLEREGCPGPREAMSQALQDMDVRASLRAGGLTHEDVSALRRRLAS